MLPLPACLIVLFRSLTSTVYNSTQKKTNHKVSKKYTYIIVLVGGCASCLSPYYFEFLFSVMIRTAFAVIFLTIFPPLPLPQQGLPLFQCDPRPLGGCMLCPGLRLTMLVSPCSQLACGWSFAGAPCLQLVKGTLDRPIIVTNLASYFYPELLRCTGSVPHSRFSLSMLASSSHPSNLLVMATLKLFIHFL